MRRRLPFCFLTVVVAFASATATAQEVVTPEIKPVRRIKLDGVCAASLARFCPALSESPGQTRNQVICLKPYRSSLPLPCRSAVSAALR